MTDKMGLRLPYLLLLPVLFLASFFPAGSACEGADWQWYYSIVSAPDERGNKASVREFYDASTIERTQGGTMIFRTKAVRAV